MTDNVAIQLAQLRHDAIIELFVLDATAVGGATYRFHAGTNELRQPVVWQGQTYTPMPVQASGFSRSTQSSLPRPTLRVSNVFGLVGLLVLGGAIKGATVVRKRVLRKYLDAVNFAAGNPSADPTAGYADELWLVDRTAKRNKRQVDLELGSPMDVQNTQLPRRQVLAMVCTSAYRSGDGCDYTGPAVAKADDTPTSILAEDDCGRRLSSCRLRQWPNNELAFGGFPGAGALGS